MKSRVKYADEPLGDLRIVEDFLPPPQDLVFKKENVKVTMALSKSGTRPRTGRGRSQTRVAERER